jgi:branched-chain amino acid transport system permease protein
MKSRFGRSILACRDDNIAAEACGVAVNKYKVLAFTFSAFIAGLAGGLYAHFNSFKPIDFGQDLSIELLIIVVLGGLGSLTGSIFASFVIVFYNLWFCTRGWVPAFFASNPKIIYGVILVAIMLFRSKGILGTSEFTWNWFYDKIQPVWNKIIKIFKKKTPKEVE